MEQVSETKIVGRAHCAVLILIEAFMYNFEVFYQNHDLMP